MNKYIPQHLAKNKSAEPIKASADSTYYRIQKILKI